MLVFGLGFSTNMATLCLFTAA